MPDTYAAERILFVDDEPNVLSSYTRILNKKFRVYTALGGEKALKILNTEGPFTVIISDVKMPGMNGVELLEKVRDLYPDTVRMVLTGFADLQIAIDAVNKGDIFRFLTKPCSTSDLISAVIAGIQHNRMIHDSRELVIIRRLKEGLQGTLMAFTRLVEFRDPYTAGHMERTANISIKIANKLGMDADQIEGLRIAALVHDIGKIAVPAGILNKPGTLSEAEFSIIKTHPMVGAEIFKTMKTNWPIQRIILEHHERLDGSGYPYGLKSHEILQESKVLAIADFIDAVLTDRPYRRSLHKEKVKDLLTKDKGIKFDSDCVEAGLALIDKIHHSEE